MTKYKRFKKVQNEMGKKWKLETLLIFLKILPFVFWRYKKQKIKTRNYCFSKTLSFKRKRINKAKLLEVLFSQKSYFI